MNDLRTLCAALLVLAACNKPAPAAPPKMLPPEITGAMLPTMPTGHPDLNSLKVASRGPRRLSVEQLEKSLDSIGNLPPPTDGGITQVKLPADLAFTLGKPDFRRVTDESLDPSPLFMKFMVDLGGIVCDLFAQFEPARPAADRVFTRSGTVDGGTGDSAIIDANLAFMLQRFTSIEGEDAKPYVLRLRKAYDTGKASPKVLGGYQAACIALFNSPEFLLY